MLPRLVPQPVADEFRQRDLALSKELRPLVERRPVLDRARLGLRRVEGGRELMQRLVVRTQVENLPHRAAADALLAAQGREEAGVDDRRLAAARAADDRDDIRRRALADLVDKLVDEALAGRRTGPRPARGTAAGRDRARGRRGSFSAAASSIALPCAPATRRCKAFGSSSRPLRRSTQVLRLRNRPIGTASFASPGRSTGMTGKTAPPFRPTPGGSRPSWISRCCHSPKPLGPTSTTSARQAARCCSSQGCQGCPAGRP